jgi:hypothetical protein
MVSVLASSVIDRGFESRSAQTKDYITDICCFSTKQAVLRRRSKDGLAQINPILNNLWMVLKQIYWFILIWYMKHDYCQGQDFDWLNYKNVSENFKPTFGWMSKAL